MSATESASHNVAAIKRNMPWMGMEWNGLWHPARGVFKPQRKNSFYVQNYSKFTRFGETHKPNAP
jgi:hypothetical protein